MGFYAYKLDADTREGLLATIPAKYPQIIADHITFKTGKEGESIPELKTAEIIGVADDGNGLQAAVVRINGSVERPDERILHITWSLDPNGTAPAAFDVMAKPGKEKEKPYKPVHSNGLMEHTMNADGTPKTPSNPNWKIEIFDKPIRIGADAVYIGDDKTVTPARMYDSEPSGIQPATIERVMSPPEQQQDRLR